MLQVSNRESLPLSQPPQGDVSVNWFDRGMPVPREVIGSIMHNGVIVIGNALGGNQKLTF